MREKTVNGVFEGGGSKGLLYIGALRACEEKGIKFGAVAGSSAGAMTAMLIACGYKSGELERKIPEAMNALGSPRRAMPALARKSVLSSDALRTFLAKAALDKITPAEGPDVTFDDIKRAKPEISLYVVSMDLASGQPLVFSPDLTPNVPVADAVVASAAIPVAFPAQRFLIDGEVRRLVDGGVWANYPSFVFLDEDFRSTHALTDKAEDRETWGFLLDSVEPKRVADADSSMQPLSSIPRPNDLGSAERELGAFGGLVTSPALKVAVVLLPLLVLVLGVSWFAREIDSDLALIGELPAAIQDLVLLLLVLAFAFLVVQTVVLAIVVIRLGRALTDEGLVGTTAAMGVGPNVPYWVGKGNGRHTAVRLPVPPKLKTLTSHPSADLKRDSLSAGHDATLRVIEGDRPDPPAPPKSRGRFPGPIASTVIFWVGYFVSAFLAFRVVRATASDEIAWAELVGLFVIGAAMLTTHAMRRARRAELRQNWFEARSPTQLKLLCGVGALVSLGAVIWFFADEADTRELTIHERQSAATTTDGEVIDVEPGDGELSDDDWIVSVTVPGSGLDPYYEVEGEPDVYWDLDGEEVWPCLDWEAGLLTQPCFEFTTNAEFEFDDDVKVSYDLSEGIIFLEPDRWDLLGIEAFLLVAVGGVVLLTVRAWRALRMGDELTAERDIDLRDPASPTGLSAATSVEAADTTR